VSDGKHTVESEVRFAAPPELFVRLVKSIAPTTNLKSPTDGLIPLKSTYLWAETNIDMDPNAIRFEVENSSAIFKLLNSNGQFQSIKSFTQLVS
jgi:hypothetical protein